MQTEFSYVREQLNRVGRPKWKEISEQCAVSEKTIERMAISKDIKSRSDNVGKVALYFRTKEKRAKV